MTTGRINQVTIPQGTSPRKNPSASASSHGTLPFSTDNVHWQSARPFGPVRPADNHSIFATSLHYSTLVSFGHTSGTTKSTECPEHTSGKNAASSESHCLSLAKGHHVQHPSVLSWPLGHFFLQCGHFMLSEGKQVGSLTRSLARSTSPPFAQYATVSYPGTFYRAGLTHTDQIQLNCSFGLSRCLPSRYYRKSSIPQCDP